MLSDTLRDDNNWYLFCRLWILFDFIRSCQFCQRKKKINAGVVHTFSVETTQYFFNFQTILLSSNCFIAVDGGGIFCGVVPLISTACYSEE